MGEVFEDEATSLPTIKKPISPPLVVVLVSSSRWPYPE